MVVLSLQPKWTKTRTLGQLAESLLRNCAKDPQGNKAGNNRAPFSLSGGREHSELRAVQRGCWSGAELKAQAYLLQSHRDRAGVKGKQIGRAHV